ncbi:MAG: TetR/AcrR family transcriptional regulator [Anaerolineae bacterium]|nr:TetR/AcrR family transcriptional regulator [Anaerolineae bacterium]
MDAQEYNDLAGDILELERQGLVTRTFRRLDPDRQQEVIKAVLDEISAKGSNNINIRDIAARASASIGSIYQYFTSREKLLDFAMSFTARAINALFKLSQPYLNHMPLRDGIKAYLLEGIKMSRGQLSIIRFSGRAAYQGDPELRDHLVIPVANEMRHTVETMLQAAQQRGEIRPDIDLQAAARVVNGLLIVLGDAQIYPYLNHYFQVSDENMPFERVLDSAASLICDGLGPARQKSDG